MFATPIDVANRAGQHVGQYQLATFQDKSRFAAEVNTSYDKLRLAELSRHYWAFSIRTALLRPITLSSQLWFPATFSAITTYTAGQVVSYTDTLYANGATNTWVNTYPSQLGGNPVINTGWEHFFGPVAVDLFDPYATYQAGEVALQPATYAGGTTYVKNAIVTGSDNNFWVSLAGSNIGNNPANGANPTWWVQWQSPLSGLQTSTSPLQVVFQTAPFIYLNLLNQNGPVLPATTAVLPSANTNWILQSGTVQQLTILWPANTGPLSDPRTANLYHLPFGWLRSAPIFAKGAKYPYLGAPRGPWPDTMEYRGRYVSSDIGYAFGNRQGLLLHFVADIADVTAMAEQFCECLGARIALSIDVPLTQGKNKGDIRMDYNKFTDEALRVDSIMQGTPAMELDEFQLVRY